ncbi:MAG TPA: protoglobin domain-containing protein, partial [Niallia sp.]|nr:protoglobin domain-containing protein [Niallia sp.]
MKLFTAKKQKVLVLEQLDSMEVEFSLPKQFQIQIDMIGLTKVDIKRLKALQPIVEKHTDDLVKNFYDTIMKEIS